METPCKQLVIIMVSHDAPLWDSQVNGNMQDPLGSSNPALHCWDRYVMLTCGII